MQDKYSGDVGDFGNLVLLRQVASMKHHILRLGINWYRVTLPEASNSDGRHIAYLDPRNPAALSFRARDPRTWDGLKTIVQNNKRSIRALEESRLLPPDTIYFPEPVPFGAPSPKRRMAGRNRWFLDSLGKLAPADVAFLDPDNGIQPASVKLTQTRVVKYALENEIRAYTHNHDLVIVYHHRDRTPLHRYKRRFARLRDRLGHPACMGVLHFGRYSAREYVFFFRKPLARLVAELFGRLTAPPLHFLFTEISVEGDA